MKRIIAHIWPVLLLFAATGLVYAGTLGHQFLINWDDNAYVTANEVVRGFSRAHLYRAFTEVYVGNYAPLPILSYMLDYTLWGMNPAGFKLTNVLFHGANGALFYLLLLRLQLCRPFALFAALLFVVHPVQVESVAWISERKTVLAMFWFLLALLFWVIYRERGGLRWYAGSFVAGSLALLSKSVAVILPPVLIVLGLVRQEKRAPWRWLMEVIPFAVTALVIGAVTIKSQSAELGGGRVGYLGENPLNNLQTMLPVFSRYLGLLFWPSRLSAIYKPPIKLAFDLEVFLAGLVLVMVVLLTIYCYRRQRLLFAGLALFLLGLLPVSHIIPLSTLMQDRYLYFPLLGLALFVAAAAAALHERLGNHRAQRVLLGCLFVLLLPLGYLSAKQTQVWHDSRSLWRDTVVKVPQSKEAWLFLAQTCNEQGDGVCAEEAYLQVLARAPRQPDALSDLGVLYGARGDLAKSRQYLLKLVEVRPRDGAAFFNLGYNYYLAGEYAEARPYLEQALIMEGADREKILLVLEKMRAGAGQGVGKRP